MYVCSSGLEYACMSEAGLMNFWLPLCNTISYILARGNIDVSNIEPRFSPGEPSRSVANYYFFDHDEPMDRNKNPTVSRCCAGSTVLSMDNYNDGNKVVDGNFDGRMMIFPS